VYLKLVGLHVVDWPRLRCAHCLCDLYELTEEATVALLVCRGCTTRYSAGALRCPQCGGTDRFEEGTEDMPKIHRNDADNPHLPKLPKPPKLSAPPVEEPVVDPEVEVVEEAADAAEVAADQAVEPVKKPARKRAAKASA
jgi:hypothetical protein